MVDGGGAGGDRACPGGDGDSDSFSFTAATRLDEMVAAEHLAGGADRAEGVALAGPPPWWAFGPADLDDTFALSDQECGEPGAVAAASVQPRGAPMAVTAAAARVSRWVSTPMTPSTVSVSVVNSGVPFAGGGGWAGRGGPPCGRTVTSHARRRTSCLSSQRVEPDWPAVQETRSPRRALPGRGPPGAPAPSRLHS